MVFPIEDVSVGRWNDYAALHICDKGFERHYPM